MGDRFTFNHPPTNLIDLTFGMGDEATDFICFQLRGHIDISSFQQDNSFISFGCNCLGQIYVKLMSFYYEQPALFSFFGVFR